MSAELSPEMTLLLSKLTEQLNLQTTIITENITAAVIQKLEEKMKPIKEENEKLKKEVDYLNNKILNLEINSRRNNVLIHGLPEPKEEKWNELNSLVSTTLKEIGVEIDTSEIDRIQRLGKKGQETGKIRPILLATTSLQKKIQILKNKRQLKENIYITHDLPKSVLEKKKEIKAKTSIQLENEKRKRSETPSPSSQSSSTSKVVFTASGLMPPVFTPLNDDYSINYGAIPAYAKYLAENGIKSVLVGGTTGENMSLAVSDRKKLVDEWVKVGKTTGLHIQVQVGGAPLADVLDLASYCQKAGADSLLTLPELYFKPANVEQLVFYVGLVAKAAPKLPVLYYHIPSMSKVEINMPAFVTEATARIPNFKGLKFTSNDLSEGAEVLRALKEDQEMFLGADTLLAPAALLGIRSSIGTTFNLFPRLAQDILDAVENNDVPKARELQEKLSLAIQAHTVEGPWVPIMKAGMEIVSGIKVGPPSLPQRAISAEAKQRIQTKLRSLSLAK